MNLNLYKTYVKVVETQNLSRTADEFGLSQPAVTKQIQALEDIYGVLLLERSGRRLKTTEAGETLYHCAREILKALEKTEKLWRKYQRVVKVLFISEPALFLGNIFYQLLSSSSKTNFLMLL